MSKTVKRVMTVTLIGLTILGAKAEAHALWVGGKPRYCSVCDDHATLEKVPPGLYEADLIVKTQLVTISCPDGTEVKSKNEWTLIGESAISVESGTGHVKFSVFDQPIVDLEFCGVDKSGPVLPDFVRIRKMSAKYKAYECNGSDPANPCSSKELVSTMKLNDCKIPPDAVPGPTTFYACDKPIIKHVHPEIKQKK